MMDGALDANPLNKGSQKLSSPLGTKEVNPKSLFNPFLCQTQ
jgi:hypothetical protein